MENSSEIFQTVRFRGVDIAEQNNLYIFTPENKVQIFKNQNEAR